MEVKTITYKRVHNLGNFSSEHLEMTAELISDEDEIGCVARLKELTEKSLGIEPPKPKLHLSQQLIMMKNRFNYD